MALSIGIVGLPNVGKSTLFNALVKTRQAAASNFAFSTIDPNVGIVNVPDERLQKLYDIVVKNMQIITKNGILKQVQDDNTPKIIPATVEFIDIAGLVKEAHKGEGLGNKFLSHIRNTDAICMVLRCFEDPNIMHVTGKIDPKDDLETIKTELELADLGTLEKIKDQKSNIKNKDENIKKLNLLADKPIIFALNVSEEDASKLVEEIAQKFSLPKEITKDNSIVISAKVEEDLIDLDPEEQKEYLNLLFEKSRCPSGSGSRSECIGKSGLDRLIQSAYKTLGLQSFLTAGPKEVRAWTVRIGAKAPEAAGRIHTDFEKGFIRAEVISYEDYIKYNGEQGAKSAGKLRSEGKEYVVKDGDIIEFRFNV